MKHKAHVKHWLQILGGALMLDAFLVGRVGTYFEFNPTMFKVGALIFLSSFLTWKAKKYDDHDG